MSRIVDPLTGPEKTALPRDLPLAPPSGAARRAAARSLREDTWENEGGHLAAAKSAASSHASAEGRGRVRKAKAP